MVSKSAIRFIVYDAMSDFLETNSQYFSANKANTSRSASRQHAPATQVSDNNV